jgi:hypothetical protein
VPLENVLNIELLHSLAHFEHLCFVLLLRIEYAFWPAVFSTGHEETLLSIRTLVVEPKPNSMFLFVGTNNSHSSRSEVLLIDKRLSKAAYLNAAYIQIHYVFILG